LPGAGEDGNSRNIRAIARAGDPDRTLAALFAPREARADLFALYAFNAELARIAEQVSEPDLGLIRLQWWRDAVARGSAGEASGHPVADAVSDAIRRRDLPQARIDALIDARQFDIAEKIMPSGDALDAYLRATAGNLFALAAQILGVRAPQAAADAAGIAYGLTGLMRSLPFHAPRGRVDIPAALLQAHGASPDQLLAGETGSSLGAALAVLRERARVALEEAQAGIAELGAPARTAFLPLSLVDPYLKALEKVAGDPFREIAGINPLYRLWRMATWR
jgi:phytoene synthase